MRKSGVQDTKIICCNRFSILLSIYDVNISSDRSNILEYPEFVVIRKEFRFAMEIFYLGVEQFLEAIMNREPTRFLYNLGTKAYLSCSLFKYSIIASCFSTGFLL